MSLVSDIRSNTANVRLAKLALAQAIVNKGSSVGEYTNVPTFSNIILGVNNILSVKDISGVEESIILAGENIARGDLCELAKAMTDHTLIATVAVASTYTSYSGTGTGSIDQNGLPAILNGGEIIFLTPNSSYSYQINAYAYIRTEEGYEQMKLKSGDELVYFSPQVGQSNSGYKAYQLPLNLIYDKTTDKIYSIGSLYAGSTTEVVSTGGGLRCWTIDRENKAMIPKIVTLSTGTNFLSNYSYPSFLTLGGNGLLFFAYPASSSSYASKRLRGYYVVVDGETAVTSTYGSLDSLIGFSSSVGSNVAVDTVYVGASRVFVLTKETYDSYYASSSAYRVTQLNVTDGAVSKVGTVKFLEGNVYSTSMITHSNCSEFLVPRVCMNNSGHIFAIDKATTLHTYVLGFSDMSLLEYTPVFDDGLDITKISFCRCTKEDDYLYIMSVDTSYTAQEQHRLYQYDSTTNTYVFVCCPPLSSSPEVQALVARNRTAGYDNIKQSCFLGTDGMQRFYKFEEQEFEYSAMKSTSNKVTGANAYGVAMENIASNETGKATVILKA